MARIFIKLDIWFHKKAKWHIQFYEPGGLAKDDAIMGGSDMKTACGIPRSVHGCAVSLRTTKPPEHLICKRCLALMQKGEKDG